MSAGLPAKQPFGLTPSGRVRPGLVFGVPLSDGSQSLGFVRATNVLFGAMAVLLFEDSLDGAEGAGSRVEIEQDRVLAFLLTGPNPVRDGTWPLVPTEVLALSSREWAMLGRFDADRIRNPVVHAVSRVKEFLEAARGLRDWDEPLGEEIRPADLLLAGRGRPRASRRKFGLAMRPGNGDS
jgi:hypothetical protein